MALDNLYQIILSRKKTMPEDSYVASLFKKGKNKIIQKVGEEATEVVVAAKDGKKEEIIWEVADLWFHILVLLASFDIKPKDIFKELEKRNKKKAD